ncbi:hypothetical protein ACFFJB_02585 [Camelimonas abortus]|uniref:NrtR DNA-binding winged helix domain-containing protein n=1 Tax=Camelimonas abortus TaxID=1017184 RepID=A0ABV7LEM8_9HYPH
MADAATHAAGANVLVDLVAVIVAVNRDEPQALTVDGGARLPAGPFGGGARSLQAGLREWVEKQTRHPLGYIEQLYTFADRDRQGADGQRVMSISYLALTRRLTDEPPAMGVWLSWYECFPWEDWRGGQPAVLRDFIEPALREWAAAAPGAAAREQRLRRAAVTFGLDGAPWHDDMVLQRYELLHEAQLTPESRRSLPAEVRDARPVVPGRPMAGDHRRILATGVARLRGKIRYRPVVFELMPETFTLLDLQKAVEALAGRTAHKQNFRRLVEQQQLVEETSEMSTTRPGRPARLFRFREEVLWERAVAGTKPAG